MAIHPTCLAVLAAITLASAGCKTDKPQQPTGSPERTEVQAVEPGATPQGMPDQMEANQGMPRRDDIEAFGHEAPPGGVETTNVGDSVLSQEVRNAITSDGRLSLSAQNSQITTRGGIVTLRGAVVNEAERAALIAKARSIPGVVGVDDRLELTADK